MPENLYCEPCRQLLCGEVSVIKEDEWSVTFNHHDDFQSFDKAMKLPCAICGSAWTYAPKLPSALPVYWWSKLVGKYDYTRYGRLLSFFQEVLPISPTLPTRPDYSLSSGSLVLKPWPVSSEYKIVTELSSSTQLDSALNFFLQKYRECREKHAQCNLPERLPSATYPSRLLDVGTDDHSLIILRSTDMFHGEEYICLSHCWGDIKLFTLNATTKSALARGINITTLPKTFQDTIRVTRRLRIRYLWIDSLCILQDSKDDWARESGQMGHIYSHAACTIAATASKDSSGGLFFERCPQLHIPKRVHFNFSPNSPWLEGKSIGSTLAGTYLCDIRDFVDICIEYAPLNSRAWVSQERQLSRRILHFTRTQLFWECYECKACETYPERLPKWARPVWRGDGDVTLLKDRLHEITRQHRDDSTFSSPPTSAQGLDDDSFYQLWRAYRSQYSKCALTHSTDKLVAIRGIASLVGEVTGDEFVAGLWRSRIIEEMCWTGPNYSEQKSTEWIAPTWSWASSNSQSFSSMFSSYHGGHHGRRTEAELVELDVETKASGELEYASIKIKCKPLYALYTPASDALFASRDDGYLGSLELIGGEGVILECGMFYTGQTGASVTFDHDLYGFIKEQQYGYVVVMQHCINEGSSRPSVDIEGSNTKEGERSFNSIEKEEGTDNEKEAAKRFAETPHSEIEALFLQRRDGVGERFERIGLFEFRGLREVNQVLKAHHVAEDEVITLV